MIQPRCVQSFACSGGLVKASVALSKSKKHCVRPRAMQAIVGDVQTGSSTEFVTAPNDHLCLLQSLGIHRYTLPPRLLKVGLLSEIKSLALQARPGTFICFGKSTRPTSTLMLGAGFTKTVGLELAQKGNITCNAICPGYVFTDLVKNQLEATAKARGIPKVPEFSCPQLLP